MIDYCWAGRKWSMLALGLSFGPRAHLLPQARARRLGALLEEVLDDEDMADM